MYQSVLAELYFIPTLYCLLVTLPFVDVFLFEIWLSFALYYFLPSTPIEFILFDLVLVP